MGRNWTIIVACMTLGAVAVVVAQAPSKRASVSPGITRGKYIVDNVAKCGDCHTPRDEKGQPIQSKYLQGGDLGVQPIAPNPVFTRIAPDITARGVVGWSLAELTKSFQTGTRPDGEMFRPPMPGYTMNRKDAEAVAAYLKSLN
jgi:mono/diheme cytochrome c family protein